jgi:hypothetical protein
MRRLPILLSLFLLVCATVSASAQEKSSSNSSRPAGGSESGGQRLDSRYLGRLLIGDDAPDFDLPASDGTRFHLHSVHGLESVAVIFVQRPTVNFASYAAIADSLRQNGIRVLFLCAERLMAPPPASLNLWVLYDHKGDVAQRFGAYDVVTGATVPALFLLDRTAHVRFLEVGSLPEPDDLNALATHVLVPETKPASRID